jgi:hypothetical protein
VTGARIWIAAAHDAAHRNGGWAYVRANGDVVGWAGGERRTTRAQMALTALAAALKDLPPGVGPAVVAPATRRAGPAHPGQTAGRPAHRRPRPARRSQGRSPAALDPRHCRPEGPLRLNFANAWADLAAEKAKMGGTFADAIPKTNLAKVAGL